MESFGQSLYGERKATDEGIAGSHSTKTVNILDVGMTTPKLMAGTIVSWLVCLACALLLPEGDGEGLNPIERQASLAAGSLMAASLVIRVIAVAFRPRATLASAGTVIAVVVVIAVSTNTMLFFNIGPVVVDPITNVRRSAVRWAEWVPTSFAMTFVVEALDAENMEAALITASTQALSTACGAVLPMISHLEVWLVVLFAAVVLHSHIYFSLWSKWRLLRATPLGFTVLERDRYHRLKSATLLHSLCACTWSIFVVNWASAIVIEAISPGLALSVTFVLDAVMDVIAKFLYAMIISETHDITPVNANLRQQRWIQDQMSVIWRRSADIMVISQKAAGGELHTSTSPAIVQVLDDEAFSWINGKFHLPNDEDSDQPLEVDETGAVIVRRFEEVVALAWSVAVGYDRAALRARLPSHKAPSGEVYLEGMAATFHGNNSLFMVLRNVTERVGALQERHDHTSATGSPALPVEHVENYFALMHQELKNSLLSALSLTETIQDHILKESQEGAAADKEQDTMTSVDELFRNLRHAHRHVVSSAISRDVLQGIYSVRVEPVQLETHLTQGLFVTQVVATKPSPLPLLLVDPNLLTIVHRNAMTTIVKLGGNDNDTHTTAEFAGEVLALRVYQEAGKSHHELLALDDPNVIFASAGTVPGIDYNVTVAKTIKLAAQAMDGTCELQVLTNEIALEVKVPSKVHVRPGDEPLGSLDRKRVMAIGIDDSRVQRRTLKTIFQAIGVLTENVRLFGASDHELKDCDSLVLECIAAHPDFYFIVIVDEVLSMENGLDEVSGTEICAQAIASLEPETERRVLILVRTALESAADVERLSDRVHGCIPKKPFNKTETRTLLAPFLAARFPLLQNATASGSEASLAT